jgi:hypothetical protein
MVSKVRCLASSILGSAALTIVAALLPALAPHAFAAEIDRVPYEVRSLMNCTGVQCVSNFPLIGAKRRFEIKFASCFALDATGGGALDLGTAVLGINDAFAGTRHVLLWNIRLALTAEVGEISQPVIFAIFSNQRPSIRFVSASALASTECNLSGDLVFLQ